MRHIFKPNLAVTLILIATSMLIFNGCTDDDGIDVPTDGSYWTIMSTEELNVPGAVYPLGHNHAIVGADNEYVYTTTDGGHSWSSISIDPATGRSATDIYFTSARGIMAGERGMLYTTDDDGASWENAASAQLTTDEADLFDIIYPATGEDNPLFIAGAQGYLLRSTDLGVSWEELQMEIWHRDSMFPIIDSLGDTIDIVDTILYATQEMMGFYGGYAVDQNLAYIMCDTFPTDEEMYVFRTTDGGDNWEMLVMSTTGSAKYYDCYFCSDTTGLIFGESGTIHSIEIAGSTVTHSFVSTMEPGQDIKEAQFINSDIGWVVGANGAIAKSTNAGANWARLDVDITGDINDIAFLDLDEGWIVGNDESRGTGAIKSTTDGGATWLFRSYGLGLSLYGLHFIDSEEGWIVGKSGRIAHTTDGGNIWIHQDANISRSLQDVHFTDANHGCVVGFSTNTATDTFATILYTNNGGESWNQVDSLFGHRLNQVEFHDGNTGWAVGNNGLIMFSNDGGATWTTQDAGVSAELFSLDVRSSDEIYAVGQYGTIIHTDDGGATWESMTSGTEQTLTDIDMVNSNTGYICGNMGCVLKTTDGGSSWTSLALPAYSATVYNSVGFINSDVGWIVGKFGYIMHTIDGGETWYRQEEGFSEETLNEIFILDAANAWIIGDASLILKAHL